MLSPQAGSTVATLRTVAADPTLTNPRTHAHTRTQHTRSGFYIARAKGFYSAAGLEVELLSPHTDAYKATPASKVADGSTATFACVPSESIISHHTWPGGVSWCLHVLTCTQTPCQLLMLQLQSQSQRQL